MKAGVKHQRLGWVLYYANIHLALQFTGLSCLPVGQWTLGSRTVQLYGGSRLQTQNLPVSAGNSKHALAFCIESTQVDHQPQAMCLIWFRALSLPPRESRVLTVDKQMCGLSSIKAGKEKQVSKEFRGAGDQAREVQVSIPVSPPTPTKLL